MIEKNIDYFKKIYDYNINDGRLSVHGCITKETLKNVADSYLFFRDILNFKRIWFLAISEEEWSKEDAVEYDKQCDIIFHRYIKDINNSSNKEVEADNYAPFNRYNILNCERNIPCGAGRNFISITCPLFSYLSMIITPYIFLVYYVLPTFFIKLPIRNNPFCYS